MLCRFGSTPPNAHVVEGEHAVYFGCRHHRQVSTCASTLVDISGLTSATFNQVKGLRLVIGAPEMATLVRLLVCGRRNVQNLNHRYPLQADASRGRETNPTLDG